MHVSEDPTLLKRLFAKRQMSGDCWLFTGCGTDRARGEVGYGFIRAAGKTRHVHRVSAALWLGLDLDGSLQVCHTCDTRACFNPAHLFLGTHQDNMEDRRAKGGYPKGEQNHYAKLKQTDVDEIRAALARGVTKAALGRAFGVDRTTILAIALGRNWRE